MPKGKKRKNPGVGIDFKRARSKVGKTLPKAANATDTTIRSRSINLPGQNIRDGTTTASGTPLPAILRISAASREPNPFCKLTSLSPHARPRRHAAQPQPEGAARADGALQVGRLASRPGPAGTPGIDKLN